MNRTSLLTIVPFLAVVTFLAIGIHLYFYRRLIKSLTSKRAVHIAGAILFGLLGALIVLGPLSMRFAVPHALRPISRVSFMWWAVSFYLFMGLLLVDIGVLVARLVKKLRTKKAASNESPVNGERREFLMKSARFSASVAAIGVTGFGFAEANRLPRISKVHVKLPRLPATLSGMTLAHLSDIHVGGWIDRKFVESIVARTNELKPDVVVITGDLVDGSVRELRSMVAPLMNLQSQLGTYFVTGNHEYYSGANEWCAELTRMGITVLRNRHVAIGRGADTLDLVGVDDWAGGGGRGRGADLDAAVAGRDRSRAAILLAHRPRDVERAAALGMGLQLSGHTHGGQIWPWTYMVRRTYPYFSGLYSVGGMALYVSNGCGFWGPPVRVGAPSEIVHLVLSSHPETN
ncbi:MAG: metallophosphoesterase [Polyangiaceae bacterium]|nr:metallophosphoesterase [Polyangiaceae bacterium]